MFINALFAVHNKSKAGTMSSRIKIQHYVPRFFLSYFSIGGEGNHVYCFDKSTLMRFTTNLRNIACESYFYDISEDTDQQVEKMFSRLESLSKVECDKLLVSEDLSSLSSKLAVAWFIITQQLRTKEHRKKLHETITHLLKKLPQMRLNKEMEEHHLPGIATWSFQNTWGKRGAQDGL